MRYPRGLLFIGLLVICTACATTPAAPKAVSIYDNAGAKAMTAGDKHALHGCREMALKDYLEAVELFTLSDNQKALATAFNNIGTLYLRDHKPDEAMLYLQEAQFLHHLTHGTQGEIRALTNMAAVHIFNAQFQQAEDRLNEAETLAASKKMFWAPTRLGRINLLLKRGQPRKALEMATALEKEQTPHSEGLAISIIYSMGRAHLALGEYALGLAQFEKALKLDTQRSAFRLMADDMKEAAACLNGLNRHKEAAWYLCRALKITALVGGKVQLADLNSRLESLPQKNTNQASPVTDFFMHRWTDGKTFAAPCD